MSIHGIDKLPGGPGYQPLSDEQRAAEERRARRLFKAFISAIVLVVLVGLGFLIYAVALGINAKEQVRTRSTAEELVNRMEFVRHANGTCIGVSRSSPTAGIAASRW